MDFSDFHLLMHLFLTKGGIRIFEFGFISIDTWYFRRYLYCLEVNVYHYGVYNYDFNDKSFRSY